MSGRLVETLGEGLSERFGEMLCKRFGEMLDPNMLQLYFRQASWRIQESLYLSQLPSPDEDLVFVVLNIKILVGIISVRIKACKNGYLDKWILVNLGMTV